MWNGIDIGEMNLGVTATIKYIPPKPRDANGFWQDVFNEPKEGKVHRLRNAHGTVEHAVGHGRDPRRAGDYARPRRARVQVGVRERRGLGGSDCRERSRSGRPREPRWRWHHLLHVGAHQGTCRAPTPPVLAVL